MTMHCDLEFWLQDLKIICLLLKVPWSNKPQRSLS